MKDLTTTQPVEGGFIARHGRTIEKVINVLLAVLIGFMLVKLSSDTLDRSQQAQALFYNILYRQPGSDDLVAAIALLGSAFCMFGLAACLTIYYAFPKKGAGKA